MSKFDDLNIAQLADRAKRHNYRVKCIAFLDQLMNGLAQFLGCHVNEVSPVPIKDDKYEQHKNYSISESLHMGEDGYYYIGIRIRLQRGGLINYIRLKNVDDKFILIFDPFKKEFKMSNTADINDFYQFCFDKALEHYNNSFDRFLHGNDKTKIGFLTENIIDEEPL